MAPRRLRVWLAAFGLALSAPALAELHVWMDDEGRTHVTDDPEKIPAERRQAVVEGAEELSALWDDGLTGEPVMARPGGSSSEQDRLVRALRAAVDDLGRGETARASTALEAVLASDSSMPEPHWYLALLDGRRGRFDSAEAHLRRFLLLAGDRYPSWRASAQRRLARLEDERRLMEPPQGALRLVSLDSPHFRVQMDEALQRGSGEFAATALRYLEDARLEVGGRLGVQPAEPTGVVLYGRAAYLRAHRHRFSFQTVGFFDGRIHVVSAAHPAGELRTLLFHEYTHALFRERVGGDRPFWLNEGLAELSERQSNALPALTRSEWGLLRRSIDADRWIPLRRLAPSFSGLTNQEARLAYLQATAAAAWIEQETDAAGRARLLGLLGQGRSDDEALRAVLGRDTAGVEAAVQASVRERFVPAAASAR